IDSGKPCNRQTPHSHNFLTQDGNTPEGIAKISKAQVMQYPTIEFMEGKVTRVGGENNQFVVYNSEGQAMAAKKILFATGLKDLMPKIRGFADCWGISVIHCPYCHGYEYRNEQTGIFVNGDMAFEFARLINNWTKKLTVFTNGVSAIDKSHREQLVQLNIDVVETPIQEVRHTNGILDKLIFADGSGTKITALYAKLPFEQHSDIPINLGCQMTDAGHIQTDDFQKTSIPGIYAAGDNANMFRTLSMTVAAGTKAGAIINQELIAES
ncbi:MAG TPA: NAD(P)/FAD-dependent oxidoreductase, partial [Pedobacter sp.]|uniref:NAD(P)/FAD-dependent oxidoreductase n=1 Tax=Pedobacter sp. TaxID=1411316 RepID=UPI002BE01875